MRKARLTLCLLGTAAVLLLLLHRFQGLRSATPKEEQSDQNTQIIHDFGIVTPGDQNTQIVYDFGVVTPGSRLSHRFVVQNNSHALWRLARTKTTCSCTIVKPSSDVIEPGRSQPFDVAYHVPGDTRDDSQSVMLGFNGPGEPVVTLTVKAKARKPLTVQPSQLSFGQVAVNTREARVLLIENYTDTAWDAPTVENLPACVRLVSLEKGRDEVGAHPRQSWAATFRLEAAGLPVGTIEGRTTIRAGNAGLQCDLPVTAAIIDDVSIAPSVVNFGRVVPGRSAGSRLMVWVRGKHQKTFSPQQVVIRNDSSHPIQFEWAKASESCWLVTLRLTPKTSPEPLITGTLTFSFPNGMSPRSVSYSALLASD